MSNSEQEIPYEGKVYTLEEQILRAQKGSQEVREGNYDTLEDLIDDD